jgi:hypothetical protein
MEAMAEGYRGQGVVSLFVYTREAHPGENYPEHRSLDDKLAMAREFRKVVGIRRPILVDDLEGAIHRHFGMLPNMAWILSRTGKVVYKAEWTQPASIERALEEQLDMKRQQRAGKLPVALYVEKQEYRYRDAAFYDGLRRNGPRAVTEFDEAMKHRPARAVSAE